MPVNYYRIFIAAFCICVISTGCSQPEQAEKHADAGDSLQARAPAQWGEPYSQGRYDISLRVPGGWNLMERKNLKVGKFTVNVFKKGTGAAEAVPLGVHAKSRHSYVAVWPYGIGTELPYSQYTSWGEARRTPDLQFAADPKESRLLKLKDGSTWAYFIVPENPPATWGKYGFIFAQVRTTNNSATCYAKESGEQIPLDQCDFLTGDKYVREADLDQSDAETIRRILQSISLEAVEDSAKAAERISVAAPRPNEKVSSPLTVRGQARGSWFFEGSFTVELVDGRGNRLARQQAEAKGEWMTNDFVPFTATLKFQAPGAERGYLLFHRANPSGLPENAQTYRLPVSFTPQQP